MRKIQLHSSKSVCENDTIFVADLPRLADMWIMSGQINRHSETTTSARRHLIQKVSWFLDHKKLMTLDIASCRAFLLYATMGHKEAGGNFL